MVSVITCCALAGNEQQASSGWQNQAARAAVRSGLVLMAGGEEEGEWAHGCLLVSMRHKMPSAIFNLCFMYHLMDYLTKPGRREFKGGTFIDNRKPRRLRLFSWR
jgi:hypothetical protein